jgi:hypothetical protein
MNASDKFNTSLHANMASRLSHFNLHQRDPFAAASYSRNNLDLAHHPAGMKSILVMGGLMLSSVDPAIAQEAAPRHEIGLTLGGLFSNDRSDGATGVNVGPGSALQANYGFRFLGGDKAALYGEVHLLANPLRDVTSPDQSLTRDVATLFVTPGIRVKFSPNRGLAPYLAIGGGWADYQHSTTTLAGGPNPAPQTVHHGAFDYGGGVDLTFWRFVGLRAEIRDFYAGGPSYNTPSVRGGQHNLVAGGGLVLKFH